ncbi:Protein of unknown function [Pyronema omphalodes CBS 100304]|uniref:Uncharacterized protein n=1 Tax=Pyronema omphalodes (strain CBS 100304) TaxID=1076935 RepID=U4LXN9_PYROM|nr:Protein of unknown function [Pyronema omphalodes CBS 100304]
MHPCRRNT